MGLIVWDQGILYFQKVSELKEQKFGKMKRGKTEVTSF